MAWFWPSCHIWMFSGASKAASNTHETGARKVMMLQINERNDTSFMAIGDAVWVPCLHTIRTELFVWQYRRHWWHETHFSLTTVTFDSILTFHEVLYLWWSGTTRSWYIRCDWIIKTLYILQDAAYMLFVDMLKYMCNHILNHKNLLHFLVDLRKRYCFWSRNFQVYAFQLYGASQV